MRVILVSGYYPPDTSMGAARAGAVVDYLRRHGHSVRVITRAEPWIDDVDESGIVIRTPWIRLPSFRIVRSSRPARKSLGPPKSVASIHRRSLLWGRISALAHNILAVPDTHGGWIPFAYRAGRRQIGAQPADIILASGPGFSAHVTAALLAARFGIPWVADYRDLWTNGTYYHYNSARRALDASIERRTIRTAALVTAVSSVFVDELVRDFGVAARLVRNGFDPVGLPPVSRRAPLSPARVNVLYVGNSFYGGKRSPQLLFRAARELGVRDDDLRFHFLGTDAGLVMPIARAEGVDRLVQCYSPASRLDSIVMQGRADALMLLLWNNVGESGILPGKLFEYAGVRRPIILVGYGQGEAARIVRDHSLGWIAENQEQARFALEQLLEMKSSTTLLPDLPESNRRGLAREEQCEILEQLLLEVLENE